MAANEGSVYTNFSNVSIGTTSGGGGFKIAGVAVTSSAAELNIMDGVTATAAEINAAADVSTRAEVVTTTNVITAAETGKTFYLNLAGGFTSTLPAPAIGLEYRFVVKTQPTTAYIVTTNAGADVIFGSADVNSTKVLSSAQDKINFVANTAIVGDWVRVTSDGTNWYVNGDSGATGGITFTVT